jgi:transposase
LRVYEKPGVSHLKYFQLEKFKYSDLISHTVPSITGKNPLSIFLRISEIKNRMYQGFNTSDLENQISEIHSRISDLGYQIWSIRSDLFDLISQI